MFSERDWNGGCYFIGIGGVSMSALALLLRAKGIPVRGSDLSESNFTKKLQAEGISVHIGESESVLEPIVVYTGAIPPSHPQLAAAREAGKRLIPRAELLGRLAEEYPQVLSVAGCHGKTTATSMLAHIFLCGRRPFTCHIGGEDLSLGNCFAGGGEFFLTEACEFRRSFLSLKSTVAVILNVELDHTDCYRNVDEIVDAYRKFAARASSVVVNADDPLCRDLPHALDFGLYAGAVRAADLTADAERYRFTVTERGIPTVRVDLAAVGKTSVMNALAAYAAARLSGFTAEEIKGGLEEFRGVKRRFERIGVFEGADVVVDYAHHPREIAAVLQTARRVARGEVHLVFQPHTYTRTKDLMEEFLSVLKEADAPIIYKTYAARERFDVAGSAFALAARLPDAVYVQSCAQLRSRLQGRVKKRDLILVLGAGDIDAIARRALLQ